MIRRVKIENYKSLRSVDVRLQPLTVLFGPNASGKSNFIDALQLLSRIAGSRTLKEAFEPPCRGKPLEAFSFEGGGLDAMARKESLTFTIEADIALSEAVKAAVDKEIAETKRSPSTEGNGAETRRPASFIHHDELRYRIEIGISPQSGVLHVADEYVVALGRDGKPKSRPQPFVERKDNRIHLRMEGQSHPTYFDRYLDHAIVSRPYYAPHYPHLAALKKELESWFFYYFEPRERMRAPAGVKEVRHIGPMGEELAAFLNTLRNLEPDQFNAVQKALHSLIPSMTGIGTAVNRIGEVELTLIEDGVEMPARIVSEGTLRVLGLLALSGVREPPAMVGFEEPENGVHPRRIRDIAKILENRVASGDTQLLVTTHSPTLLDHLPIESLFKCRKVRGVTTVEPMWGDLARKAEIDSALDEEDQALPLSELILRGDLDA